MTYFDALILGIVEGITEFLPISSTGHLILAGKLLGLEQSSFLKSFDIVIQLGAICAVLFLYGKRLRSIEIDKRLLYAFLPTAIIGLLLYPLIKGYLLGSGAVVIVSLFVGGVGMIVFERWYSPERVTMYSQEELSYKQSFFIGLAQVVALIPGVSRSAATSIGGMILGLERKATIEFSFLLAIPTMIAATGFDLLKNRGEIFVHGNFSLLLIGFSAAFVCAYFSIGLLLRHVERRTFRDFGWYRIVIAIAMTISFLAS